MVKNAQERRYWPWWWQFQSLVGLTVSVGIVTVETVRGTYDPVAMGFAAAGLGLAVFTEFAKVVLRRMNGSGGQ